MGLIAVGHIQDSVQRDVLQVALARIIREGADSSLQCG